MNKKSCLLIILLLPLITFAQLENVRSTLEIYNIVTNEREIVRSEEAHFEAPNWSSDGSFLLINQDGKLYKVDLETNTKTMLNTDFADRCNNDHGISFDGKWLAISHQAESEPASGESPKKGSRIYVLPIEGGTPKAVTPKVPSYWHGWSPDGKRLAYCAERNGEYDVYTISIDGGEETRLTTETGLDDGPEYSPNGKTIYYNSMASGKMEIWQMNVDGSNKKQLTNDTYSNWFAHPSPDGEYLVLISYHQDQGSAHPAMKEVSLRLMNLSDGSIKTLCSFTGGQGTINVPSWAPDGNHFAFVSYEYIKK
ncbi:TolB family protein [Draconibacterium sp.]|uniref:TolB family protein n=1 Tax=Draconibacterium sp. TaxID=1965318 RepID=UPI003569E12C